MSHSDSTSYRSPAFLCFALGLVYLHFGMLKLFPDLSPAEMIATQTVIRLSWSWLDAQTALWTLAVFECLLGIAFLFRLAPRWVPFVFFAHMAGTCAPLFLLPELTFKIAPFAPTLEGQYILKNLVFIAAAWTVLAPRYSLPSWLRAPGLRRRASRRLASPAAVAVQTVGSGSGMARAKARV